MPSHTSSWDNTTLFVDDDPADRAFRAEVREWIARNLPAELCNRPMRIDPPELKPWHRKLYERGWIAPHWPREYGGMGATLIQQIILFEEISRVGAPTPYPHGLNFIGPLIIEVGTPEQKARHLPGILTGTILALSRAVGETAPLITIGALTYVAFLPPLSLEALHSPFTALPIQIFNWISRPQQGFHVNAAAGIVVLLVVLLTLNAAAIMLRNRYQRR